MFWSAKDLQYDVRAGGGGGSRHAAHWLRIDNHIWIFQFSRQGSATAASTLCQVDYECVGTAVALRVINTAEVDVRLQDNWSTESTHILRCQFISRAPHLPITGSITILCTDALYHE